MDLESVKLSEIDAWDVVFGSTRAVFGVNGLDRLGDLARAMGATRVLIVTDPGIRGAGHVDRARRAVEGESMAATIFDDVAENPTTLHVERGARIAAEHGADCIVGLGGGSAMDCAKGINFLLTNGGRMEDYQGYGKASKPLLPSIGVPATAGTGSEAQSYALISRESDHVKMACGAAGARFGAVVLDPVVAASVGRDVAAVTGIDAVTHAIESFVSTKRNPLSQSFSREAWRLLHSNLPLALSPQADHDVWGRMLIASYLAGAAIEHSMLGAAHATANPLTARFAVIHGTAVGLMLPHAMRFNAEVVGDLYDELRQIVRADGRPLWESFNDLRTLAGLPGTLRECGVPRDCLPDLAADAAAQWTAGFNPRPVTEKDLRELYEAAY